MPLSPSYSIYECKEIFLEVYLIRRDTQLSCRRPEPQNDIIKKM